MRHNGHKNWNHWNVSLWINNTEYLYDAARHYVRRSNNLDTAASLLLNHIRLASSATKEHPPTTPDGAPYTYTSVRAALRGWNG